MLGAASAVASSGSIVRGIYSHEEEDPNSGFASGVPTFDSKDECMRWCEMYSAAGSNPGFPHLMHIFTHLVDWNQVKAALLPKMHVFASADAVSETIRPGDKIVTKEMETNVYGCKGPENETPEEAELRKCVREEVLRRLNLPFHRTLSPASSVSTLEYLFFHMRCGIFVMFRGGNLVMFVPFVNKDYKNNWGEGFRMEAPFDEYYDRKSGYYRRENILRDKNEWWANGNIICNEHMRPGAKQTQWWGDHLLSPLKAMLEAAASERAIPDCEFFINKRDHPHLKCNLTEPYDFVFDKVDVPLSRCRYENYAPIMSFYCGDEFADIPFPTTEDWEGAVGKVFPRSFIPDEKLNALQEARDLYTAKNFKKFHKPWKAKVNTAFFRGNATGGGTMPDNNQRLKTALLSKIWEKESALNDELMLLDAGVTGYNVRDKKMLGTPMTFCRNNELPTDLKRGYVPMYEQGLYKYILYVEGHCAANRYAFLMRLGSVIFKVESTCTAKEMWFFPLLRAYEGDPSDMGPPNEESLKHADHIRIKPDQSDLKAWILWCREHDDACKRIAENALKKYKRWCSRDRILDYIQLIAVEVAKRFVRPPSWWSPVLDNVHDIPCFRPPTQLCSKNGESLCRRCRERQESEAAKKRKALASEKYAEERPGAVKRTASNASAGTTPKKRPAGPVRKGKHRCALCKAKRRAQCRHPVETAVPEEIAEDIAQVVQYD